MEVTDSPRVDDLRCSSGRSTGVGGRPGRSWTETGGGGGRVREDRVETRRRGE